MTVRELRKLLMFIDSDMDDCTVYIQGDDAGESFANVKGIDQNIIIIEEEKEIIVYDISCKHSDVDMTLKEWNKFKKENARSLIIHP